MAVSPTTSGVSETKMVTPVAGRTVCSSVSEALVKFPSEETNVAVIVKSPTVAEVRKQRQTHPFG